MNQTLSIKVIDITDVNKNAEKLSQVAAEIRQECCSTGFFILKMPEEVAWKASAVLDAAREFFRLPLNEKQKLNNAADSQMQINGKCIPGTGSGYRGVSEDPNFKSDTRESYNMGPNVPRSLFTSSGYSGSGMTPWPDDSLLPGWKKTMQDYAHSLLTSVVPTLCNLFAVSLGLDPDFFAQIGYFDNPTWLLGLTHYYAERSDASADVYGIRPHCDSGVFTLLLSDGRPGLQVCLDKSVNANDRVWLDVEAPTPGQFIVNLGQVLERWSGAMYKATMHRVMLDGHSERWSVPFFYDPNIDLVIKPLVALEAGRCTAADHPESLGEMMLKRLELPKGNFE